MVSGRGMQNCVQAALVRDCSTAIASLERWVRDACMGACGVRRGLLTASGAVCRFCGEARAAAAAELVRRAQLHLPQVRGSLRRNV